MNRTNVHLTEHQRAELARLQQLTGLSQAEHIRRALDAYLIQIPNAFRKEKKHGNSR